MYNKLKLVFLLVVILLLGCSKYKYDTSKGCINYLPDKSENWKCLEQLAKEAQAEKFNIKSCDKYKLQESKEFCRSTVIQNIAIVKNDISICDTIEKPILKWQCYRDYSEDKKDIDSCLKIPKDIGYRDDCIFRIAVQLKNIDTCDKIGPEFPFFDSILKGKDYCVEQINSILRT